ncbi:MAG: polysaccharide deacetylase family protein [Bacteroidales bacterium]|nr:polysaccharide deacetylase family protein [Bacteroidales bacterium]
MIKIFCPNNFEPERKYIIDTLLGDFLGLEYEIFNHEDLSYKIVLENDKILTFNDSFWSKFDESKGYLSADNIPHEVQFTKNQFTPENDIPVIFGDEQLTISETKIDCGIDIFSSSFFMLSRWEENVIQEKDIHQRFPCNLSLAQKHNFHYRPIVNEYLEMLWNMLQYMGCTQKRKQHIFEIIPTHDIDYFRQFNSFGAGFKHIAGDLLKRKSLKMAFDTTKKLTNVFFKKQKDAYDSFDFFMDFSEKYGLKSHFYFIAGQKGETDVDYNFLQKKVKSTLDKIQKRGHVVGIHGGYDSYNNPEQFQKEIDRFKESGIEVKKGRQHYLRFQIPETWQMWDNLGMKYDSTIGYTNDSGFRAGICHEYPVFDVKSRKKLDLIELPLIFMETASQKKYPKKEDFLNNLTELKNTVKRYNGQFVFLWHNSNVNSYLWRNYIDIYPEIFR